MDMIFEALHALFRAISRMSMLPPVGPEERREQARQARHVS